MMGENCLTFKFWFYSISTFEMVSDRLGLDRRNT